MLATCICLNGSLLDQLSCTIVYLHNLFTCTFGRINMSVCLSVCSVADWPMGQNLFLMSHPDVSLVNILLSITRVSLVQNKCVFCQLRVLFNTSIKFQQNNQNCE